MNSKRTIHILTDENYHMWANEIKLLLKSKGYWKFIQPEIKLESSTTISTSDPRGKDKDKVTEEDLVNDEKALGLIGLYLSEKFQDLIIDCEYISALTP